jgi:hypothetical protein
MSRVAAVWKYYGYTGQERRRPAGGGGLDRRPPGTAEQERRIGHRPGDDHDKGDRHHGQQQQVDRVADVVGEEAPHEHERSHRGTALPSRTSTMRSKR